MFKKLSQLLNRIICCKGSQCNKCLKYTGSGSKVLGMCWPCVDKLREQIIRGEIKLVKK